VGAQGKEEEAREDARGNCAIKKKWRLKIAFAYSQGGFLAGNREKVCLAAIWKQPKKSA